MSLKSKKSRSSVGTSSILKKSSSLKRRYSDMNVSSSQVRFQLPHTEIVRKILENFLENNETKEYFSLICLIRDAELLDNDLLALLKEATECISLLNRDLKLFVEALLAIKWINRDAEVVNEYQNFLINLLSAHNYHAKFVIYRLVNLFLPDINDPEWPEGRITNEDLQKCLNVHLSIKVILHVVPMCKDLLLQAINRQYPYYNRPTHTLEYYLHNLLMILDYQPLFKEDILHLIFIKLIKMDVNAPREVIQQKVEEDDQMDDDGKSVKTVSTTVTVVDRNSCGFALDACMDMVLNYIIKECQDESGEINWENIKEIYGHLITVFDKVILPTYGCHHVQFVLFSMCSLNSTVTEGFLNHLWKKVSNPNLAIVIRQTAVTYIASLVARGIFVTIPLVKDTMQKMAEWIHSYAASQDGMDSVNSDVRVHTVFYSVCQALFYILAFRHKDLVEKRKNIIFLQSLQLGKIVTNRLNPLRVCQHAVVQNFAAITRKYQLAYCYSIIDHNTRNYMPTIYNDAKGSQVVSDKILNDFYPFDPYVLPRSGEKIFPHYRDYQEDFIKNPMEITTDSKEDDNDFLENLNEISIHQQNSYSFSYGTSPGFKFKT